MRDAGQQYKKFSDLSLSERDGIRAIFADSSLMSEFGPNLMDDGATFGVERRTTVTLTYSGSDVPVRLSSTNPPPPPGFEQKAPTREALELFTKQHPEATKIRHPDALISTFATSRISPVIKNRVMMAFLTELNEQLEAQQKAWKEARAALDAPRGDDKFAAGASWLTLDASTRRMIEMARDGRFREMGFANPGDAAAFFDQAKIKSTSTSTFIGIAVVGADGTVTHHYTSVDVQRN